jgi:DNA (cytosine-5)-methyltransferase 1
VLDAQNFGVAQRRRRVFVVGCLGGWESAAKVLFESESLSGNIKQGRKKGESVAAYVESSFGQYREDVIAGTTKASGGVLGGGSETFLTIPIHAQATQYVGGGNNRNNDGKGNGLGIGKPGDPMNTLDTSSRHAVAFGFNTNARPDEMNLLDNKSNTLTTGQRAGVACIGGQHPNAAIGEEVCPTLTNAMGAGGGHVPIVGFDSYNLCETGNVNQTIKSPQGGVLESIGGVFNGMAVRRLTEVECERLQGFPDNYTNIKENCPSGARYKALGNSMAVPVMRWIGERINGYEQRKVES